MRIEASWNDFEGRRARLVTGRRRFRLPVGLACWLIDRAWAHRWRRIWRGKLPHPKQSEWEPFPGWTPFSPEPHQQAMNAGKTMRAEWEAQLRTPEELAEMDWTPPVEGVDY